MMKRPGGRVRSIGFPAAQRIAASVRVRAFRAIRGPCGRVAVVLAMVSLSIAAPAVRAATQWEPAELPPFTSKESLSWNTFPLRVDFVNAASGRRITVDGYWDGGNRWVVRYALPETGTWNWTATSSDSGLRGSGSITVDAPSAAQVSANRNYRGQIRVGPTSRYFVHADGTPFLYVGDTLWAINSTNASANAQGAGNFYTWASDRKSKG